MIPTTGLEEVHTFHDIMAMFSSMHPTPVFFLPGYPWRCLSLSPRRPTACRDQIFLAVPGFLRSLLPALLLSGRGQCISHRFQTLRPPHPLRGIHGGSCLRRSPLALTSRSPQPVRSHLEAATGRTSCAALFRSAHRLALSVFPTLFAGTLLPLECHKQTTPAPLSSG